MSSDKKDSKQTLNDLDIAEANTLYHENRASNTSIKATWKLLGHDKNGNPLYETPAKYQVTQSKEGKTIKLKDLLNPPEIEGE